MSEVKTAKAAVELTKNEDGTWLTVDIGGRKATVSLNNSSRGPMITGILTEWAESHFLPTPVGTAAKRAMTLLSECLIAGTVTILLLGAIAGALWLVYTHAGAMAEGFGAALAAGLLGGGVRYFRTTRRLLHKMTFGKLFK